MAAPPRVRSQSWGLSTYHYQYAFSRLFGFFCGNNPKDGRVENMMRFSSLLLAQLVWIFRSSASVVVEKVTIPAPIVVDPSQSFDGNDGPFSSFNISVGTPPQSFKVFISTSVWQTLVVQKEGCGDGKLLECATLRGGNFFPDNSSTWQVNTAVPGKNLYKMLVDPQLGYDGPAALGFDVVSLAGSPGATLQNQTVGGFASNDSFLGLFGIDPRASNFTGQAPIPSYFQMLRSRSLIPSLSWGYTAGNRYRSGDTFGSLTLGGYDKTRFEQHDGSWPIDGTNDLNVQVQAITWVSGNNGNQGLLPTPITATIDSSLPYIWLPKEACALFELAFGLEWNNKSQLYLIDDTTHTTLMQQNASITFNLGGMTGGSSTNVNITLPYAAFDLSASSPLVDKPTRYFPLKRAANTTQYVIGRTFFQEAFVVADYERRNFSVFPCKWTANTKPEIVSVFSPSYNITPVAGPGSSDGNSTTKHPGKKSNPGAVAGGVIAGIAGLAIIATLIYFFWWRPKRRSHYTTHGEKPKMVSPSPDDDQPHLDKAELGNTQRVSGVPELEGSAGGVFEMPAREEVASEMRATIDAQEMPTPETASDVVHGGFPWRRSVTDGGQSPSPLSSPGLEGTFSPMSSPSLGLPSPIPSPSMIPSSIPSPIPSPPPVIHPQPQRVLRPDLKTVEPL